MSPSLYCNHRLLVHRFCILDLTQDLYGAAASEGGSGDDGSGGRTLQVGPGVDCQDVQHGNGGSDGLLDDT